MAERVRDVYASALFDAAASDEERQELLVQLRELDSLLGNMPDYMRLMATPAVSKEEKRGLLEGAFAGQVHPKLLNLKYPELRVRVERAEQLSPEITGPAGRIILPMAELLDVTPGSATILALMNDREHKVKLILDNSVLGLDHFGCHPCANTSSLSIPFSDIREKLLPALGVTPLLVELPEEDAS